MCVRQGTAGGQGGGGAAATQAQGGSDTSTTGGRVGACAACRAAPQCGTIAATPREGGGPQGEEAAPFPPQLSTPPHASTACRPSRAPREPGVGCRCWARDTAARRQRHHSAFQFKSAAAGPLCPLPGRPLSCTRLPYLLSPSAAAAGLLLTLGRPCTLSMVTGQDRPAGRGAAGGAELAALETSEIKGRGLANYRYKGCPQARRQGENTQLAGLQAGATAGRFGAAPRAQPDAGRAARARAWLPSQQYLTRRHRVEQQLHAARAAGDHGRQRGVGDIPKRVHECERGEGGARLPLVRRLVGRAAPAGTE